MWDADKYPYKDIMNMFYVISLTLAREPKTQVWRLTFNVPRLRFVKDNHQGHGHYSGWRHGRYDEKARANHVDRYHCLCNLYEGLCWALLELLMFHICSFIKGGAPVWFHTLHMINTPRLFEVLYSMAKPLLNDKTKGNVMSKWKPVRFSNSQKMNGRKFSSKKV